MSTINDRYQLLEVIASGGMATVWRARDTRLDRLVAVKRPHPSPRGDESAERLGREARAAAALNHPNLITVYDFGADDDGPYLVMELVEGPTLQDLVGELEPADVTDLGARLADALAAIHAAGIVHRDVKPANVIMTERGPLLTDFGIAFDPNATREITQPGTVVATPSHAAPEVLRGDQPTPASDVYSLGVIIDELFRRTGSTPDPDVDGLIAASLSDSPDDRPSAGDLAASLRHGAPTMSVAPSEGTTMILATTPTPPVITPGAGPDDERERLPAWMWVAALLVVLALGLIAAGLALSGDEPPADAAVVPTSMVADATTTSSTTTSSTTTTSTVTTVESLEAGIAAARDDLESALSRPPRSDFNPPEVEDVMKKVDEGIAAALEGDLDEAEEKFVETGRRLEEKLDGDRLDEARAALEELADLLGVDLDSRDRDDDDDDDDD